MYGIFLTSGSAAELAAAVDKLKFYKKAVYSAYAMQDSTSAIGARVGEMMSVSSGEAAVITTIFNLFLPLAYALVAVFFLLEVVEKATNAGSIKELDYKFFIAAIFKLALAEMLLTGGTIIIGHVLDIGNIFIRDVQKLNFSSALVGEALGTDSALAINWVWLDVVKDMGLLDCIVAMMNATIVSLAKSISEIVLLLHAASKKIEIIIMASFAGLAMTQCFSESTRAGAVRYLKKFLACVLHAAAIIAIVNLVSVMAIASGLDISDSANLVVQLKAQITDISKALEGLVYNFAAIGSVAVAKSIINDALGT